MNNNVAVYTCKLAKHLLRKGYRIVNLAPNRNDERMIVFYFEDENEIHREINEFMNSSQ